MKIVENDDWCKGTTIKNIQLKYFCIVYSLQVSDSASESIQIDATGAKTSEVLEDTNKENRQVAVQLNIVEDDENLTSEHCCAPRFPWVFHDIETTVRARKCPIPKQILKWILHLIFWLIASIFVFGAFSIIAGFIGGSLFGIGYLFYLGTEFSIMAGVFCLIFALIFLCAGCVFVDKKFKCGLAGLCEYLCDTSS